MTTEANVLDPGDEPQVDRRAQLERTRRNDRPQPNLISAMTSERRAQIKNMVSCPKCHARPGQPCRADNGKSRDMHIGRVMAAIRRADFKW